MAGGEVVETDNMLVELQQGFDQVAADEAGDAGDEPGFGLGLKLRISAASNAAITASRA